MPESFLVNSVLNDLLMVNLLVIMTLLWSSVLPNFMKLAVETTIMYREIEMQDYKEYLEEIIITEEELQERISELGSKIDRDYKNEDLIPKREINKKSTSKDIISYILN